MKKKFFFIGLIAIAGLSMLLVSCKKEERECKCTYISEGRTRIFKEFPTNENAKDCSDLGTIMTARGETSITCK
jgi:hypothetical protein